MGEFISFLISELWINENIFKLHDPHVDQHPNTVTKDISIKIVSCEVLSLKIQNETYISERVFDK